MANWVVTGGCGFIGSSLVKKILKRNVGDSVRVVDNFSFGNLSALESCDYKLLSPNDIVGWDNNVVNVFQGDILDQELSIKVCEGADFIVHLAANTGVAPSVADPRMDCTTNVIGVFNYLEAAREHKVKRFVFASSGAPVGEVIPPIHEEIVPHPVSPYGASKLCGEAYCSAYYKTYGVETVALRFGNVYGPGSAHKSSVVAKFMNEILDGKELTIYGDGTQTRDYIYLNDLINAVVLSTEVKNIGGEVFQIATNTETTLNELTDCISKVVGEKGFSLPRIHFTEKRLGDVLRNFSDTSKANNVLGWRQTVKLEDGLRTTFEYFLDIKQ